MGVIHPISDVPAPTDLLVLGELNPDILVDASEPFVAFDQVETEMSSGDLTLGSSGAITAVAAHRFGLSVAMAAVVGDDTLGTLTVELLGRTGVDTRPVRTRADLATGLTVVVNAPGGNRALLTYPGAMTALTVADVPPAILYGARHVHVSSLFLQRGLQPDLAELLRRFRARAITTSVDTGWDPQRQWTAVADLLPWLDLLLPNEAELRELNRALELGADEADSRWVEIAAAALSRRGPAVAVKRGGAGGLLCNRGSVFELTTTPLPPLDTTGAGDNFNAGFLFALLTGEPPDRRLASAVAAGRLSIRGRGGTGGIGSASELHELTRELVPSVRTRAPASSSDQEP